jgi:hypothetical protein
LAGGAVVRGKLLHAAVRAVTAAVHLAGLFLAFEADHSGFNPFVRVLSGRLDGVEGAGKDKQIEWVGHGMATA